jgi:hypothetical protein
MLNTIKIMSFNIEAETLCNNTNSINILNIIKIQMPEILGIQEIFCIGKNKDGLNLYQNCIRYELHFDKKLIFIMFVRHLI